MAQFKNRHAFEDDIDGDEDANDCVEERSLLSGAMRLGRNPGTLLVVSGVNSTY